MRYSNLLTEQEGKFYKDMLELLDKQQMRNQLIMQGITAEIPDDSPDTFKNDNFKAMAKNKINGGYSTQVQTDKGLE